MSNVTSFRSYFATFFTLVAAGALAGGCAAPTGADENADDAVESDLQTKTCPASFSLTVTDIRATPIKGVSADDRPALTQIQSDFVAAGTIHIKRVLSRKKNGVCDYKDPSAKGGSSTSLYGTKGHNVLQFEVEELGSDFSGGHRVYAFPTAIATTGLTFDASDNAILDGVTFSGEGPNLVVKVGLAKIEN